MKPLHTSSQVTASDSRMVVRVGEISTPDGPVRRIVVEANAEMDTTETRWLRDKLDLAITLAESPDPNKPCPCFFTDPCSCPGWTAIKDCPCYRHTVPNREPAVSEDQPKPREWHKGDEEPPADVTVLEDHDGDRITRGENGWVWTRVIGEDYAITPWSPWHAWADIDWTGIDTLSEVLADSEQVRHG